MNVFERIKARAKLKDLYATARPRLTPEEFEKFKAYTERMYQIMKKKKRSVVDVMEFFALDVKNRQIIENASEEKRKCQK